MTETPAEFVSPENLGNNQKIVQYSRTFLSIIAGCVTGVLGLTGSQGFLCYTVLYALISLALFMRMKFDLSGHLPGNNLPGFLLDGITGQALSFLLFWTLSYALVHIY